MAKGKHCRRDAPVPAMPGPGVGVIETGFVPGGFETVLVRPALSVGQDQGLGLGSGRAPGGEDGRRGVGAKPVACGACAAASRAGSFGQAHELPLAAGLPGCRPDVPGWIIGDRGYASDAFRARIGGMGARPAVPPRRTDAPAARPDRACQNRNMVGMAVDPGGVRRLAPCLSAVPAPGRARRVGQDFRSSGGAGGSATGVRLHRRHDHTRASEGGGRMKPLARSGGLPADYVPI